MRPYMCAYVVAVFCQQFAGEPQLFVVHVCMGAARALLSSRSPGAIAAICGAPLCVPLRKSSARVVIRWFLTLRREPALLSACNVAHAFSHGALQLYNHVEGRGSALHAGICGAPLFVPRRKSSFRAIHF